ncbi:hypothetical protein D3C85_1671680 [compost metagenome]
MYNQQILFTACYIELAIPHKTEVPCCQIETGIVWEHSSEILLGGFLVIPIAFRNARAGNPDLSDLIRITNFGLIRTYNTYVLAFHTSA